MWDKWWDRMGGCGGMMECVGINKMENVGNGEMEVFGMALDGWGGIVGGNEGLEEGGRSCIVVSVKKGWIRKNP